MVRHIVLFSLNEGHDAEVEGYLAAAKTFVGQIPGLIHMEMKRDFLHSERSYDVGLIATLESREALEVYANHPIHLPLKKGMAVICKSVVCCDFDID